MEFRSLATDDHDTLSERGPNLRVIEITDSVSIPLDELEFRFSRGGGPGGQHVNRSATRVELLFRVSGSPSLTTRQQDLVRERLAGRIDDEGVLRVVAHSERSQLRNREEALERFQMLLRRSLHVRKERRLEGKRRRSEVKLSRRRLGGGDG
jgi:ribosome-associated protein